MNGFDEPLTQVAARLELVSNVLYGREYAEGRTTVSAIVGACEGETIETLRPLLRKMNSKDVVYFDGQTNIELVSWGRQLYKRACVPEVVLGFDYIDEKYSRAVVRVAVRKPNGDPAAGTGFFINDPPNHIVSNQHVAQLEVTQIEDLNNNVFHRGDCRRIQGPEDLDLDLALIQCEMPAGVVPLRIAWERQAARPQAEVLVLGYPLVAGLMPGLHRGRGRVGMVGKQFNGNESLVLSELTDAGGSGGPVINAEGMVIAVVSQQSIAQGEGHAPTAFVNGVPSHYLRKVLAG
jgi:S1-C subfamily serine protease